MTKQEFLKTLECNLSALSTNDLSEQLQFYAEIIDDKIEDGICEEDATAEIGNPVNIAKQILSEYPLIKIVKEKIKQNRRLKPFEIVLLVMGSPVWLPILISVFAVFLSVYVSLWAIIISLWAVFASLLACVVGFVIAGVVFAISSNAVSGIAVLSAAFVCAGVSIFFFFGCKVATKGFILLTKKFALWVKNIFSKKDGAKR